MRRWFADARDMTNELNETTRIVNLPMAHIVYGPPPAKPATKRDWFWAAAVLGASLWGFSGCGDNTVPEMPESCAIPSTSNAGFQDCGGSTLSGYHCVTLCGESPQDGTPGKLVGYGCLIPQAETPEMALCVNSCSECH